MCRGDQGRGNGTRTASQGFIFHPSFIGPYHQMMVIPDGNKVDVGTRRLETVVVT